MKSCLFILLLVSFAESARILAIFYFPGKSQYLGGASLVKILTEKGHDVTFVSAIGDKNHTKKNYKHLVLHEINEHAKDLLSSGFNFNMHPYIQSYIYSTMFAPLINKTLSSLEFRKILDTRNFDLVIVEQFYSIGLNYIAHYLGTPLIVYSSIDASSWTNPIVGNAASPSFVPDMLSGYTEKMTFLQRLDNSITFVLNELIRNFIILPAHNEIVKQNFPNAPDISVYQNKVSLVFLNGHPSINQAVPKVPAMIDIGGFHIEPPKPLPEDLIKILDTAKHGVILFSLGSIIKCENMPNDKKEAFFEVFSKLKQTVLWKCGVKSSYELPKNVVIREWLPQNDILSHKNVKLFITHGGIHSIQEAVLIIPIFGDQYGNSKRATEAGFSRSIEFEEITKENLLVVLKDLLHNPTYIENATKISTLMKDRIVSPADSIAYWVDYVIRHKGADHLRVPYLELYWYQYFFIDVILFIFICIMTIKFIINKIVEKIRMI